MTPFLKELERSRAEIALGWTPPAAVPPDETSP